MEAIAELRRVAGTQCDPAVVDALCRYLAPPSEPSPAEPPAEPPVAAPVARRASAAA
jgi:HD-GYP domain-containing protein (c-di-GMP phosphodiesterase class II)